MPTAQRTEPAPIFRNDTMLGVCESIGQDFGFHPNWLRIALGSIVLWNPWAAFGIYLGLGVIVGLSHLIAPQRFAPADKEPLAQREEPQGDADTLPLAA